LTIALSVASAPTTDCSLALSLHTDLPVVLTIVHFDGTSILSLHNSGKNKATGIKWQVIVILDGLLSLIIGPFEGKANDWKIFEVSGTQQRIRKMFVGQQLLYLYRDLAYNCGYSILSVYKQKGRRFMLLKEQYKANRWLANVQVSVEHAFGHVTKYWTYTAFAKGLCPGNQPVAASL
jgi:hypothetical protein